MKKFLLIFVAASVIVLGIFALFGGTFDFWFSGERGRAFFTGHRDMAGPLGAALLVSDLLLPIPTTVVIGALGAVLGIAAGAFWGWLGLTLAALTGYGLARRGGRRWADRLASPEEQETARRLFNTWGGLAVVVSRMLPVLPEVLSVLAGLYGMRPGRFVLAASLGSIPPALVFSWIGATSTGHPLRALALLVGLTAGLWIVFVRMTRPPPEVSKKD